MEGDSDSLNPGEDISLGSDDLVKDPDYVDPTSRPSSSSESEAAVPNEGGEEDASKKKRKRLMKNMDQWQKTFGNVPGPMVKNTHPPLENWSRRKNVTQGTVDVQ